MSVKLLIVNIDVHWAEIITRLDTARAIKVEEKDEEKEEEEKEDI